MIGNYFLKTFNQLFFSSTGSFVTALNSPHVVGHMNFLEPTLTLMMRMNVRHIDLQLTLYF
jgi:hypothetical protein